MNLKHTLLLATSTILLTVASAHAQVVVRIGPPPRPVERVPPPPPEHRDFVWVAGYHRWDGREYVWVPGAYQHPPHANAVWVPGEWRGERGGHVWHEGYWK